MATLWSLCLGSFAGLPAEAQGPTMETSNPPALGVWTATVPGPGGSNAESLLQVEAVLDGVGLDLAPLPASLGGGLGILTRGRERESPRTLWRLSLDGTPASRLVDELPGDINSLARVGGTLWLGREGGLDQLRPVESPDDSSERIVSEGNGYDLVPRLREPGFDLHALRSRGLWRPTRSTGPRDTASDAQGFALDAQSFALDAQSLALEVPTVGALRLYRTRGQDLERTASLPLPATARRTSTGLWLESPRVERFPDAPSARETWAVGPVAADDRRLRTLLLTSRASSLAASWSAASRSSAPDSTASPSTPEPLTAWSRLPGPETVQTARALRFDRRPTLVVTTTRADKIGAFEKQALRVLPLTADRTRTGRLPSLAVETDTRRYYAIETAVDDVDGDGFDDLILAGPEGLGAGKVQIEIYRGTGDGRFARKPLRSELDLPQAALSLRSDLDGDGTVDLVARSGALLAIYPLRPSGRRAVERTPWLTFRSVRPGAGSEPEDVDADLVMGSDTPSGPPRPGRYAGTPRLIRLDAASGLEGSALGAGRLGLATLETRRGHAVVRFALLPVSASEFDPAREGQRVR